MASQTEPILKVEGPATVAALVEDDEETTRYLCREVAPFRLRGYPDPLSVMVLNLLFLDCLRA